MKNPKSPVPLLSNLREDLAFAAAKSIPVVILFSRSDCSYCHEVRVHYLAPLISESGDSLIVREVMTDRKEPVIHAERDYTNKQFGAKFNVRFYPTLMFFNASLNQVAEPLLGADKSGFYGAYLERRITAAREKIRAG